MLDDQSRRKYSLPISIAGVVVLLVSARFGSTAVFLIGFPALFIACGIAAGARTPSKIPNRDALVYVGIAVVVVIGVVLYAFHSR
jgi:hypothetical protein